MAGTRVIVESRCQLMMEAPRQAMRAGAEACAQTRRRNVEWKPQAGILHSS